MQKEIIEALKSAGIEGIRLEEDEDPKNPGKKKIDILKPPATPMETAASIELTKVNGKPVVSIVLDGSFYRIDRYVGFFRLLQVLPKGAPVIVWLNTPGGDVNLAVALVLAMMNSRADVKLFCIGQVMSAGGILYHYMKESAFIGKFAHFMYHMSVSGSSGNTNNMIYLQTSIRDKIFEFLQSCQKDGAITSDEYKLITEDGINIYIQGTEMAKRMGKSVAGGV